MWLNFNISNTLALVVSLMALSTDAFAGPSTGGGGGAFVCYNSDGSIRNSELVDLWEARNLKSLPIPNSSVNAWVQAESAIQRLMPINFDIARHSLVILNEMKSRIEWLQPGVKLNPPTDVGNVFIKPNCPLAGAAYYDDYAKKVYIDREIMNSMISETDVAALLAHEALYRLFRTRFNAVDSIATRAIVGCLFSSTPVGSCLEVRAELVKVPESGDVYHCTSEDQRFQTKIFWGPLENPGNGGFFFRKNAILLERAYGVDLAYGLYNLGEEIAHNCLNDNCQPSRAGWASADWRTSGGPSDYRLRLSPFIEPLMKEMNSHSRENMQSKHEFLKALSQDSVFLRASAKYAYPPQLEFHKMRCTKIR